MAAFPCCEAGSAVRFSCHAGSGLTKGQIALPQPLRRKLGIRAGDLLDIAVEDDRIVVTVPKKKHLTPRIIKDPITGFVALDAGPDAPVLTSEMVRELLVDFP
jgi:AbrB family looped-hinge helix DNA binding protein